MTPADHGDRQPPQTLAIDETIEAIARLHTEHHASATLHQRTVDRFTVWLSRPSFIAGLTVCVFVWMLLNVAAPAFGLRPLDPTPFPGLACALSLASLYFVVLILTTQRRDESLSRRRELLTLELAILSEQKMTKVVALLEELRRDSPSVHDRVDVQAAAMAKPAGPQAVIEAIKEARSSAGDGPVGR